MKKSEQEIIQKTAEFVKQELASAEKGHDWFHIERVWKLTKKIGKKEKCNLFIAELGILLHDIADYKFHNGDTTVGPRKAKEFLEANSVDANVINEVIKIIENISFKGALAEKDSISKEFEVAQDADRLDAMGAIGIARAFHYGGFKNRAIHDPNIPPNCSMRKEEFMNNNSTTVNHFYEKILLLQEKLNTETGKKMGLRRHKFIEKYLEEFYKDVNC
jgi:uncharacterized protein